jgi:hypothetical protein
VDEVLDSIMLMDLYCDFPTYSEGILGTGGVCMGFNEDSIYSSMNG